jgi:phosphohistidine phosphatase
MAQMAREAKTIARLKLEVDLILTSPLARAHQTADIVAGALGMRDCLVADRRLAPGFGVGALLEMVREHPGLSAIIVVGHEPDFSETISALIGGGRVVCKKGSLARVDLPADGSLNGELVWLVPPGILAA